MSISTTFIATRFLQNKWKEYGDKKEMEINGIKFIDFDNNGKLNLADKYEYNGKTGFIGQLF